MKKQTIFASTVASLALVVASCGGDADTAAETEAVADSEPVALEVPSGVYELDPRHSILQWSLEHLGASTYYAKFTDYDVTLDLDAENLENSSVSVVIRADSVSTDHPDTYTQTHAPRTGYPSWDEELGQSERFMFGEEFPEITFQSTSVEQTGPTTANVTGDLTFRGLTQQMTLETEFTGQLGADGMLGVPMVAFTARGALNAPDFGVVELPPIGSEVEIYFNGELHGPAPEEEAEDAAE